MTRDMGAAKDIIVAVELGSSAIRAIAGKKQPDGTLQIVAVALEENINCIRNGVIENLDKTSLAISRVVKQLDDKLNIHTKRIYIGLSGQSVRTVKNPVMRHFDTKTLISNSMIDAMKDINQGIIYPDAQLLDVFPQEYRVDKRPTSDPVGQQGNTIEACFANVIARSSLSENIEQCVRNASLEVVEIRVSPICLSDMLFSTNEKRSGCALVDIGADTTTIIIYTNNLMRQLVVIPLGGSNVTSDIASQNIEMEEAEALKLKYGSAFHEDEEDRKSKPISISHNRTIEESKLQDIIEARYEEILLNVWNRIKEYNDKVLSGVTFTGGAARIANLKEAFEKLTTFDKQIRIAKGIPANITLAGDVRIENPEALYTLMALALCGEPGCATEPSVEPEAVQQELDFTVGEQQEPEETKAEEAPAEEIAEEKPKKARKKTTPLSERLKNAWVKISKALTEEE